MVGIDLRQHCSGAVVLARWMAKRSPTQRFFGVHIADAVTQMMLSEVDPQVRDSAIAAASERALESLYGDDTFSDLGTVNAKGVDAGLEAAARDKNCSAVIMGRRKPTQARALIRLGRSARRMLRRLAQPVVVTPPDLAPEALDAGPVLVATDLGAASEGAARFGSQVATNLGLDILFTHVASVPSDLSVLLPAQTWNDEAARATRNGTAALTRWIEERNLTEARHSVVEGAVVPQLLDVAKVSGASLLVVGSRQLKGFDRLFISSAGSELAAAAAISVAVVPSTWT